MSGVVPEFEQSCSHSLEEDTSTMEDVEKVLNEDCKKGKLAVLKVGANLKSLPIICGLL